MQQSLFGTFKDNLSREQRLDICRRVLASWIAQRNSIIIENNIKLHVIFPDIEGTQVPRGCFYNTFCEGADYDDEIVIFRFGKKYFESPRVGFEFFMVLETSLKKIVNYQP